MKIHALIATVALVTTTASAVAAAPQRVTIFNGKAAAMMLHQCSRGAPEAGSAWFRPTDAQILRLDQATLGVLAKRRPPRGAINVVDVRSLRHAYALEVTGIVRKGRRFVYGSYMPLMWQDGVKEAATVPTVVCDGGPQLFGVEIDAATGAVTNIGFNGRG